MRVSLGAGLALALVGCASAGGARDERVRVVRGSELAHVMAAVLDSVSAVGARLVEARRVGDGGALVRGEASVSGQPPLTLVLEVAVSPVESGIRVSVGADRPDPTLRGGSPVPAAEGQ